MAPFGILTASNFWRLVIAGMRLLEPLDLHCLHQLARFIGCIG
jgi:hypothetical protein